MGLIDDILEGVGDTTLFFSGLIVLFIGIVVSGVSASNDSIIGVIIGIVIIVFGFVLLASPASLDNQAIRELKDPSLRLEKSSKRLESLTLILCFLTIILAIATLLNIFLK